MTDENNTDESEESNLEVSVGFDEFESESSESDSSESDDSNIESILNEDGTVDINDEYEGKIKLVGAVHVSEETRDRVIKTISDERPDIVGIELDSDRLYSLFESKADVTAGEKYNDRGIGLKSILKKQQENLFEGDGILQQGEADMLPAIDIATDTGARIALIDMSMDRLKSEVKSNAYEDGELNLSILNKPFPEIISDLKFAMRQQSDMAAKIQSENGIETIVKDMEHKSLQDVKDQMKPHKRIAPEIIDALIDERDKYMAGHLHWLRQQGESVVAVVGRGHLLGIHSYLNNPEEIPEEYIVEPDWYSYTSISISE